MRYSSVHLWSPLAPVPLSGWSAGRWTQLPQDEAAYNDLLQALLAVRQGTQQLQQAHSLVLVHNAAVATVADSASRVGTAACLHT